MIVGFLLAINFVPCMYCLSTKTWVLGNLKNVRWDPTIFFVEDIRGVKLELMQKNDRDRLRSFLKHWKQPKHVSHLFIRSHFDPGRGTDLARLSRAANSDSITDQKYYKTSSKTTLRAAFR